MANTVESLPKPIQALYPFKPNHIDVLGGTMSYVDEGEGQAVVMLHGNPTWSFFYRNLVKELSGGFRCIAPDHIGMGLSDKPQSGFEYRLSEHVDNIIQLIDHLNLKSFHLIVHDWGGAIGMAVAEHFKDRVGKLVVMNTAAFRSNLMPVPIAICRSYIFGELFVRGLNGFAGPATRMATSKGLPKDIKTGYLYPYNSWKNRIATHRFVKDIPMEQDHPSYPKLLEIEKGLTTLQDKAMLLLWGMKDFCFSEPFLREWQKRFPDAKSVELKEAGHYLLEDEPEKCLSEIRQFLS